MRKPRQPQCWRKIFSTLSVYAPAAGRLAAAMATIWASRRPIRDGVSRSNERNRRISQAPCAPADNWSVKIAPEQEIMDCGGHVESGLKIAMPSSFAPDRQ
jgi:hypothetical protein